MTGVARIDYPGEKARRPRATGEGDGTTVNAALLSTSPARARERRRAMGLVVASSVLFCALAPFAKVKLEPMPAFLPAYQSALVMGDLITVALLIGQFNMMRSTRLLVLAGGYLFCALMALAHALSFPGLFAPAGVLGGGPQTTAWLYFLWHAAFPVAIVCYALLGERAGTVAPGAERRAVALALGAAVLLAGAFTLLTTAGHALLPVVMQGNVDAPAKVLVATLSWLACVAALVVLWRRESASVLDLWLMVVLCAWIFDIALAAVLNGGRFDLGWYAGRAYGLVAATFVMMVLLLESSRLYAHLARLHVRGQRSLARSRARLRILHEIDRGMAAGESAERIAGAVVQSLRALLGVPRAIISRIDAEGGFAEWMAGAGRQRAHVGPGVRVPLNYMGDVDGLRRGEPQLIDTAKLPPGPEVDALRAAGVNAYMAVPMIAGGELTGAITFGGEAGDFPAEQVQIAREVATQLAIAVRQAELLARVRGHADELERRVRERTMELEAANRELESFSYSVSHDLRAPLRAVDGYARMLAEDFAERLDDEGRRMLGVVRASSQRMGQLIDDLLAFSRLGRQPVNKRPIDMQQLVREVAGELGSPACIEIGELPGASADRALLKQVWINLVGNAVKYSGKRDKPRVEVGGRADAVETVYWVRDNGAGFDMRFAAKLFGVFQRLHRQDEFPGTGVGLAIVQRVVTRHGGRVWAEGKVGEGACFSFSLPREPQP